MSGIPSHNFRGDRNLCTGSCKSNYNTITITTPEIFVINIMYCKDISSFSFSVVYNFNISVNDCKCQQSLPMTRPTERGVSRGDAPGPMSLGGPQAKRGKNEGIP
jgi:hypothetical protein